MAKFVKNNFVFSNGYLTYYHEGKSNFIARFKTSMQRRDKASFQKFLINNFTVEEYFERYNSGSAPYEILRTKGWESPNVAKALARGATVFRPIAETGAF